MSTDLRVSKLAVPEEVAISEESEADEHVIQSLNSSVYNNDDPELGNTSRSVSSDPATKEVIMKSAEKSI